MSATTYVHLNLKLKGHTYDAIKAQALREVDRFFSEDGTDWTLDGFDCEAITMDTSKFDKGHSVVVTGWNVNVYVRVEHA